MAGGITLTFPSNSPWLASKNPGTKQQLTTGLWKEATAMYKQGRGKGEGISLDLNANQTPPCNFID